MRQFSKKKVFEFYILKLKESKILKEEFNCYNALQNSHFQNELDSQLFVEQNINIIKSLDKSDLDEIHNVLMNNLKENGYNLIESENEIISEFSKDEIEEYSLKKNVYSDFLRLIDKNKINNDSYINSLKETIYYSLDQYKKIYKEEIINNIKKSKLPFGCELYLNDEILE